MGLGIVGSGLLVYAYLAIIARSVSAAEYAYFGAFWSLALVAGFGVFLLIEQETARLMQVPNRPRALLGPPCSPRWRWPACRWRQHVVAFVAGRPVRATLSPSSRSPCCAW